MAKSTESYFISARSLSYIKRAAKIMRTDWRSLAAQPTNPLTQWLVESCSAGKPIDVALRQWLARRERMEWPGGLD